MVEGQKRQVVSIEQQVQDTALNVRGQSNGSGVLGQSRLRIRASTAGDYPFVTIGYAQSLDGSIAALSGHPMSLSSPKSTLLTHQLRALHEGILVGIGTVLADDPRLTVREVSGRRPTAGRPGQPAAIASLRPAASSGPETLGYYHLCGG